MSDDTRRGAADDFPERPDERPASEEFNATGLRTGLTPPESRERPYANDGGAPGDDGGERDERAAGGGAAADWNQLTHDSIRDLRKSSKFIVSLIGFPGAGKTFFLNRLKYSYSRFEFDDGRKFDIDPPYDTAEVGRTTNESYHLFNRLTESDREAAATSHAPGGSDKDFVLFDLPGEQFRRAIDAGMRGPLAALLTDAIAASDALILLFPAELLFGSKDGAEAIIAAQLDAAEDELDTLLASRPETPADAAADGGEAGEAGASRRRRQGARAKGILLRQKLRAWQTRHDELAALVADLEQKLNDKRALEESEALLALDRQRLNTFVQHLASMVARVAAMKRHGKSAQEMEAMGREEREALIRQTPFLSHAPLIYVAISKADALLSTESPIVPLRRELTELRRDELDEFPRDATAACEKAIYKGISSTFRWYKFDFLTSFEGQSHNLYGAIGATAETKGQKIHYDLNDFGVRGVIDWLEWAKGKAKLVGKRGFRAWLATAELALVRAAERSIVATRALGGPVAAGRTDGLARKFIDAERAKVAQWLMGLAALALLLTLWTTGILAAALMRFSGDNGGYQVPLQPRYPVEVERLRTLEPFRTGWLSAGPQPWSEIPSGGRMFAVPPTRRVRSVFESVLEDVQRLPPTGRIDSAAGRALLDRLTEAQSAMNEEYGATSSADRFRERPFINFHSGYVQLRMGEPQRAVQSLTRAIDLLNDATAEGPAERGRLLGVRIASLHARGHAAIEARSIDSAKQDLEVARGLLPQLQSRERILLTPSRTGYFFGFDRQRTPAVLNTADVWADSLAAHIRGFDASRDLARESAVGRMLDELSRWRDDIPRDHALAVNYVIAAALVGRPLSEVRINVEGGEAQQAAARTAKLSLGDMGEGNIWAAAARLRTAFAAGDGDAVRDVLDRWSPSDDVSEADAAFMRTLASEVVGAERKRLPRGERGPLLEAYGEHVRGAGFLSLANDLSRFGGILLGLLPLLLLGLLAIVWRLHAGSRVTADKLLEPRHREDRLAVAERSG